MPPPSPKSRGRPIRRIRRETEPKAGGVWFESTDFFSAKSSFRSFPRKRHGKAQTFKYRDAKNAGAGNRQSARQRTSHLRGGRKLMCRPKSDFSDLGSYDCQTRQKPSLVAHQLSGGGPATSPLERPTRGLPPPQNRTEVGCCRVRIHQCPNRKNPIWVVLTRPPGPPGAGSPHPGFLSSRHWRRCCAARRFAHGCDDAAGAVETCSPASKPNDIMLWRARVLRLRLSSNAGRRISVGRACPRFAIIQAGGIAS